MKFLRFLLFPFAIAYDVVTRIRNFFFDFGIFKSTSFEIPIIIVGNLSVGGTGKTPLIEYLIRLLKDTFKIAVLSRGYKRKTNGFILLNDNHTAADVGDEPLQFFKKFKGINVAVDANRVAGITNLLKQKNPDVVLLDDAYQHRKVKGSFYILLSKYNDLFVDDFLLPTGNLRENRNGANRADVIVVTKCPEDLSDVEQTKIEKRLKKYACPVYFSKISYANSTAGNESVLIEDLQNYKVLLVTGIANPNPLLKFLTNKDINFKLLKFGDHHNFSNEDIQTIKNEFSSLASSKKMILTTEKDYVRLKSKIAEISFIEIKTNFVNESNTFDGLIQQHIKQNRHL